MNGYISEYWTLVKTQLLREGRTWSVHDHVYTEIIAGQLRKSSNAIIYILTSVLNADINYDMKQELVAYIRIWKDQL